MAGVLAVALACGAPTARAAATFELEPARETALAAAGLALLVTAHALAGRDGDAPGGGPIGAPPPRDPSDLGWLDRGVTSLWSPPAARASDALLTGLAIAPVALAAFDRRGSVEVVTMQAQSLLLTGGMVALLKEVAPRARPAVYNDDARIPAAERGPAAHRSFPSGHAAAAFASAVLLGEVHARWHPGAAARPWVRFGSLAVAATVAGLRCASGEHFPTDVLAGAAIGAAVGWAVLGLHDAEADGAPGGNPLLAWAVAF